MSSKDKKMMKTDSEMNICEQEEMLHLEIKTCRRSRTAEQVA